jgi:hypothetical protein
MSGVPGVSGKQEGSSSLRCWVAEIHNEERKSPVEHYAQTALMEMLTTTATGSDLAGVLGPLSEQWPVLDALIGGLGPVVSTLLQVTLGLGGRAAAGTVSLGQAEEELRTSGRDLMRATLQAVMDAASAAQERVPGGVDGPDGVRRTRVEDGHARTVATVFGRITVNRLAYRAPQVCNVHPLDEVLDLPDGLYSTGLGPAVRPGSGARLVRRGRRRGRVRHRGPDRHPPAHRADQGRRGGRGGLLHRPRDAYRRPRRRVGDHRGRQGCSGPARGPTGGHRQARRPGQADAPGRHQRERRRQGQQQADGRNAEIRITATMRRPR